MATILITGGSGMLGTALTVALQREGHVVRHLSRKAGEHNGVTAFAWDVDQGIVDPAALHGVDHIVHLSGAGIADKRWSPARIRELIDSRARAARVLLGAVMQEGVAPKSLVSAAGISWYGAVTTGRIHTEDEPSGPDTIARISREWEEAVEEWSAICRVVKLRTPMVLAQGGALKRLAKPVRFGLGAPLGSGRQWVTWVHIDDLVRIQQQALFDDRMHGAYNVNTGHDVTNAELMRTVAQVLHRPFFLPAVPGFALRLALGELSTILLEGDRTSNARLLATGFRFRHPELRAALAALLS